MRGSKILAVLLGVVLIATVVPTMAFGVAEETAWEEFVVYEEYGPDTQVELWGDMVVWRHMDASYEEDSLAAADLVAAAECGTGDIMAKDLSTGEVFDVTEGGAPQDTNPSVYGDLVVWSEAGDSIEAWDMSTDDYFTISRSNTDTVAVCNPFIWGNWVVWVEQHWDYYGPGGYDNIVGYNLNTSTATTLVVGVEGVDFGSPEMYEKKIVYNRYEYDEYSSDSTSSVWVHDMATSTSKLISDELTSACCEPGSWARSPSIWDGKVAYSVEIGGDDGPGEGYVYLYDCATGKTKVIAGPHVRQCVDIGADFVVWSDNRNCVDPGPKLQASFQPRSFGECASYSEPDVVAGLEGEADTPMRDIYGYNIESGTEFPICLENGCQKRPRIYGNTVVWMDNRSGTYPDIWGTNLGTTFSGVAGDDRFETAVEISREAFPEGCDTVIVATGYNWPDALSASALAGVVESPILISYQQRLPAVVAQEIERLGAENAYIIGGPAAISPAVEVDLNVALDGDVVRLAGSERCGTANRVAEEVVDLLGPAYDGTSLVVTSLNFPDAVAAAPIAAAGKRPMFLAGPGGMSTETRATMAALGVTEAVVLGGASAVPVAVEDALEASLPGEAVMRIGGETRYHTAANVAQYGVSTMGMSWNGLAFATGLDFPDALTGGVAQGLAGSVVLLTPSYDLHDAPKAKITANADDIYSVTYFGGLNAISQAVRDEVESLLVK